MKRAYTTPPTIKLAETVAHRFADRTMAMILETWSQVPHPTDEGGRSKFDRLHTYTPKQPVFYRNPVSLWYFDQWRRSKLGSKDFALRYGLTLSSLGRIRKLYSNL